MCILEKYVIGFYPMNYSFGEKTNNIHQTNTGLTQLFLEQDSLIYQLCFQEEIN